MSMIYRLFILLFVSINTLSQINNDDYCDDLLNGSDEYLTSACSSYQRNTLYTCQSPYPLNITFPTSRINDGICDCCDGSDEIIKSNYRLNYTECANRCEEMLFTYRQNALYYHRSIRAGIRKRNEIMLQLSNEYNNQVSTFNQIQIDIKNITQLQQKMKFYLSKYEIPLEHSHRFELLRERQIKCANSLGYDLEPACQLYIPGFLNEKELINDRYIYKNPPKRFVYFPNENEINVMNSLEGYKRVLGTMCLAKEVLPLINKEKVFISLSEYINYMETNPIDSYRKQLSNPLIKDYLLAKYLEYDMKGYLLLAIHMLEVISFFLLPILIPIYLLEYMITYINNYIYQQIVNCANGTIISNVDNKVNSISDKKKDKRKVKLGKKNEKSIDKSDEVTENSEENTTKFEDVSNTSNDTKDQIIDNNPTYIPTLLPKTNLSIMSSVNSSVQRNITIYQSICQYIISENSPTYTYLSNLFDPLSYSIGRYIYKYISPYYYVPMWISTIIYRAPKMYFDYYFYDKASILPQRRQACLLREGINESNNQIIILNKKLKEIEKNINSNEKLKKTGKTDRKIDYGFDNSYKYLSNICIEKMIGSYTYKLCFYKNIKQNSIIIGKFNDWRKRIIDNQIDKYKYQYYDNGNDCGNKKKGNLDKQIKRNTQVELICGVENEIIDITEIELCVYNMIVSTPIACTDDLQEKSIEQLEALQVLGFTRLNKPNITYQEIKVFS